MMILPIAAKKEMCVAKKTESAKISHDENYFILFYLLRLFSPSAADDVISLNIELRITRYVLWNSIYIDSIKWDNCRDKHSTKYLLWNSIYIDSINGIIVGTNIPQNNPTIFSGIV